MTAHVRCGNCGNENPPDAQFCIDCGGPLRQLNTGATTRLASVPCPNCRAGNPENARFCVVCGRSMASAPPPPPPRPTRTAPQHSYPRMHAPPAPIRMRKPPFPAAPRPTHTTIPPPAIAIAAIAGIIILLGSRAIWPGLLWIIAMIAIVGAARSGRSDQMLQTVLWWGGIALLLSTGTIWPGILILIALSMLLGGRGRSRGRPW